MIVVGMDGEFRAQFFLCEELPQLVNQRVAILKTHGIRPELLTVWLNRNEGQYQLNRWTTQTTVGHIGLDDIRTVLVPRLDEKVEAELADKALTARQCVWYAHALTTSAKLLVEALIEAKVTEPELVAAQEALGRGDDTADRALLRRLTRHGFDVPGQPSLFPDLDALYTLLGQTTEEQS
jgi:type I restriction enzyme S subunit